MQAIKDWGLAVRTLLFQFHGVDTVTEALQWFVAAKKGGAFKDGTATSTGQYSFSEPVHRIYSRRGNPRAGCPLILGSDAKQCSFKPHAVKVVYLLVTRDVTTHPCLREWASFWLASESTKHCKTRQNSYQSQGRSHAMPSFIGCRRNGGNPSFP